MGSGAHLVAPPVPWGAPRGWRVGDCAPRGGGCVGAPGWGRGGGGGPRFMLQVPRVQDKLAQLVCPDTALLALQFAHEAANPYFRLAYNSLGAYGTINHLHFQVRA
jgi:hypothetical protein